MSKAFLVVPFLMIPLVGAAAPDLTLMQPFVGKYPLVEWRGKSNVAGTLEVFADSGKVGYRIIPSTNQIRGDVETPNEEIFTATIDTSLNQQGSVVIQESVGVVREHIEYEKIGDVVSVMRKQCPTGTICGGSTAFSGPGLGAVIPPKSFFENLQGEYFMEKAGGAPSNEHGELFADTAEAAATFPFCPTPGKPPCLLGDIVFPYSKTQVFQATASNGDELYTITVDDSGVHNRYQWRQTANGARFINFQLDIDPKPAAEQLAIVEYIMRKEN